MRHGVLSPMSPLRSHISDPTSHTYPHLPTPTHTTTDKNGSSPLHIAASMGSADVVAALCALDARLNISDQQGMTPLMIAAAKVCHCTYGQYVYVHGSVAHGSQGATDIVAGLLQKRNVRVSAADVRGWTALHWAVWPATCDPLTMKCVWARLRRATLTASGPCSRRRRWPSRARTTAARHAYIWLRERAM